MPGGPAAALQEKHHEEVSVLGRPASDLLFQVLRLSTIGAGKFNGRVRDGIGYRLPAITTRPAKDRNQGSAIRHQKEPEHRPRFRSKLAIPSAVRRQKSDADS